VARELASRARHRAGNDYGARYPLTPPATACRRLPRHPVRRVTWLHCWRCSTRMPSACWSGGGVQVRQVKSQMRQVKSQMRQRWPDLLRSGSRRASRADQWSIGGMGARRAAARGVPRYGHGGEITAIDLCAGL